jgi:outer membrane protein OmpA-like peptidoglycan-associated protein
MLSHINKLASLIYDYPELKVQLSAYADHRGKAAYNMALSKSRAQAVRNALIKSGVPGNSIYSHAHGEANANARDRESLIFDRRVDIHLTINTET